MWNMKCEVTNPESGVRTVESGAEKDHRAAHEPNVNRSQKGLEHFIELLIRTPRSGLPRPLGQRIRPVRPIH